MVKRLFPVFLVLVFIFILSVPCFAYDVVQTESDAFGFAYDDSKIYFCEKDVVGSNISVDNQLISVSRIYFYIPCNKPVVSLDFIFTLTKLSGAVNYNSCDYGYVLSNNYTFVGSMPSPSVTWLGTNYIDGSSAQVNSFKVAFTSVPFTDTSAHRYIRLTFDTTTSLVIWLQKRLDQNLSGVFANPTYSFSGVNSVAYGRTTSGSLSSDGYYITGSKKYKYYNGSSVVTDTLNLTNGTSGSGGYLYVPSHNIVCDSSHKLSFSVDASTLSGSLTPFSSSEDAELTGTYLSREYISPVVMTATRSYSDADLIEAVNDASSLNHQDLQGISDQMQEVVDHMNGLEQQGQQINGATSQETINNSTATVSSGSSSLGSMGSTVVSGAQAITNSAGSYIDFVGYGLTSLLAIGGTPNVPLYWAFVAIVFISVSFFVIRRLL